MFFLSLPDLGILALFLFLILTYPSLQLTMTFPLILSSTMMSFSSIHLLPLLMPCTVVKGDSSRSSLKTMLTMGCGQAKGRGSSTVNRKIRKVSWCPFSLMKMTDSYSITRQQMSQRESRSRSRRARQAHSHCRFSLSLVASRLSVRECSLRFSSNIEPILALKLSNCGFSSSMISPTSWATYEMSSRACFCYSLECRSILLILTWSMTLTSSRQKKSTKGRQLIRQRQKVLLKTVVSPQLLETFRDTADLGEWGSFLGGGELSAASTMLRVRSKERSGWLETQGWSTNRQSLKWRAMPQRDWKGLRYLSMGWKVVSPAWSCSLQQKMKIWQSCDLRLFLKRILSISMSFFSSLTARNGTSQGQRQLPQTYRSGLFWGQYSWWATRVCFSTVIISSSFGPQRQTFSISDRLFSSFSSFLGDSGSLKISLLSFSRMCFLTNLLLRRCDHSWNSSTTCCLLFSGVPVPQCSHFLMGLEVSEMRPGTMVLRIISGASSLKVLSSSTCFLSSQFSDPCQARGY